MMRPTPATAGDAAQILALRDELARWIQSRGAQGWRPGEVALATIQCEVAADEWFVIRDPEVVAAVRLVDADPRIWGDQPAAAVYAHGLMVARDRAGKSLGSLLLGWAEAEAVRRGRQRVRLDCGDDNADLQRYYEQQGYIRVGHKQFSSPVHSVALYEKVLKGQ